MKDIVELGKVKIQNDESNGENLKKVTINEEKKLKQKKNHYSVKEIFLEWSLRSNLDCFQKIFYYDNNPIAKFIWTLILLASSGLTFLLISVSITEYFNFEVVSQIEIGYELKSEFPAVTICNNKPFTTKEAEILYEEVAALNGIDTNHEKITEFVKLRAAAPSFGDERRKLLGFDIKNFINCSFNGDNFFLNDFHWYWDYHYGNCWQFNSGLDMGNNKLRLKETYSGIDFGLEITISTLENNNRYSFNSPEGVIIFIHNSSFNPYKTDSFVFLKPGEKTYVSVNRIYTFKQPYPYSLCRKIDPNSHTSDIYDLIKSSNKTYRQSDCFRYCRQKSYNDKCGCSLFSNDLPINPNIRFCFNSSDYFCHRNQFYNFDREKCMERVCPLECDSIKYELGFSSLVYPSFQLYNEQTYETKRNLTFESYKTTWVKFLVYYPTLEYTTINESPKITTLELLGQIGGTLSVFISMSIFTLFELIEISILVIHAYCNEKLLIR